MAESTYVEFLKERLSQHRIMPLASVDEHLFERRRGHTPQASGDHGRLNELGTGFYYRQNFLFVALHRAEPPRGPGFRNTIRAMPAMLESSSERRSSGIATSNSSPKNSSSSTTPTESTYPNKSTSRPNPGSVGLTLNRVRMNSSIRGSTLWCSVLSIVLFNTIPSS